MSCFVRNFASSGSTFLTPTRIIFSDGNPSSIIARRNS